jgi:hypothetical protein
MYGSCLGRLRANVTTVDKQHFHLSALLGFFRECRGISHRLKRLMRRFRCPEVPSDIV